LTDVSHYTVVKEATACTCKEWELRTLRRRYSRCCN